METVGISLAQIALGVLAVALAAAGAILQRGTRACVLASFAAALASVALTVVYFKCEAETGDLAAILDTADAFVLCSIVLGIIVLALDAVALARAGRRG